MSDTINRILKTMRGANSNALFSERANRNHLCPCVALSSFVWGRWIALGNLGNRNLVVVRSAHLEDKIEAPPERLRH